MRVTSISRWGIGKIGFIVACALFASLGLYSSRHILRSWIDGPLKTIYRHIESPDVAWERATPAEEGFVRSRLETLRQELQARRTDAFLVVRSDRIVYEWYASHAGPNVRHRESAMAKAVVAVPALLIAQTDHRIGLDDRLSQYVPELEKDPLRSQIRIRDLLFHQSGLDDVDFFQAERGDVDGWKKAYYENPEKRFEYALFRVPMIFHPGTREQYSGVGYYALAYALTRALQGAPETDINSLVAKRIMGPLGIPDRDWSLSYGTSYNVNGLKLFAIGSGAEMSPRAVARIGELVLDRGEWHGRRIFDARWLDDVLGRGNIGDPKDVSNHHGFILNRSGRYKSLPRDGFFGLGAGHNIVLVVPSLDLVVVRNGESLADPGEEFNAAMERHFFQPIIGSIVGAGSRSAK
jgi:CubicO group peptidase (beta-lactamase class C family)